MGRMKIGYWNVRAYAEPIRYALEYCGADYEDKQYQTGPGPALDDTEWLAEKWNLGLDFPNLPYLIDGDSKVTEAMAVLKYVCRKHGMMPKPGPESLRASMLEGVLLDYRVALYKEYFLPAGREVPGFKRDPSDILNQIEKSIGKHKWILSDEVTYGDFFLCAHMNQMLCINPKALDKCPLLTKYLGDFNNLPNIKSYLTSGRFKKFPITLPTARQGFKEGGIATSDTIHGPKPPS